MNRNILRLGYLFTTYDIFVVNVVIDIMSKVYKLTDLNNTILKFTVLCGVILGHLLFGVIKIDNGYQTQTRHDLHITTAQSSVNLKQFYVLF